MTDKAISARPNAALSRQDEAAKKAIAVISANYPSMKGSAETLVAWRQMLSALDPEVVRIGVARLLAEQTEIYPGTNVPALVRRYGTPPVPTPEEAWLEYRRKAVSSSASPWTHPCVGEAADRFGREWTRRERVNEEFVARDFKALYAAMLERAKWEESAKIFRKGDGGGD